jgi:CheY-like chemotaxis protein
MSEYGRVCTVLIADDDPDDRLLLKEALEESGLELTVCTVVDGEELVDYLHRRGRYADPADAPLPHLLLLDLHMPRKSGLEALREIKADPGLYRIPVVVLTGLESDRVIELSYALGVNAYINKGTPFPELILIMKSLVTYAKRGLTAWKHYGKEHVRGAGSTPYLGPARTTAMDKSRSSITILVAEDDPDDRMLLRDAMDEGHLANASHFVADGEELIDYLRHCGKYSDPACSPRPGLILLDLNMPRKDGREVLKEIKADPGLRTIPIVVLTTSKAEEDILGSYALGVNSYVTKPATFQGLIEVTRALVKYWFEIVELPPSARQ